MNDAITLAIQSDGSRHAEMDAYGKAHGMTVTFAPWHPTGTLLSGNEQYPSGLVIVNERGIPEPWKP